MNLPRMKWTARRKLMAVCLVVLGTMLVHIFGDPGTNVRIFWCNDIDASIRERLQYRRKRIREACETYGYESYRYEWLGDVHVDNIIWRKIPKVASTYLATLVLRRLLNNTTFACATADCHVLLAKATANARRSQGSLIRDSPAGEPGGTLLVVRRPYSRLVSGFLDKIAENNATWLWADIKRISGQPNSTAAPTFAEFVDFLIWQEDTDQIMDGHWDTQERLSRVCECDFQYIVQLETMDEELPYVIRMLGLQEEARHPITGRNSRRRQRQYNTMDFIEQLNDTQLARLDAIYRMDTILFNG